MGVLAFVPSLRILLSCNFICPKTYKCFGAIGSYLPSESNHHWVFLCPFWVLIEENHMKIINLGILAHVDAGKTTLTESLLYTSGAIAELGSVDEGTTRTDTMNLERQRGITIQTAVTSFQWEDVKVNITATPGHMDFFKVYRSLSVLDGSSIISFCKGWHTGTDPYTVYALQIMKIPTIFFINKIDQEGIDLPTHGRTKSKAFFGN